MSTTAEELVALQERQADTLRRIAESLDEEYRLVTALQQELLELTLALVRLQKKLQ